MSLVAAAPRRVKFSYLEEQFADIEPYLEDIKTIVQRGELTLGAPCEEFEQRFAALCGAPYAVGVASGTDALSLSLRALGIGHGDEVITTPMTFVATVGAVVMTGARPVLVDSEDGFVIDPANIEAAITTRTKAILPVHYTGNVADMPAIMAIARRRGLAVVEDACQAIGAELSGQSVGSWGEAACFSLHPLKNINVWGDGGVVVTHDKALVDRLRLLRNHGLVNRDEVAIFGGNSRLDTLQAVVGNRLIQQAALITAKRIANAAWYDEAFRELEGSVQVPVRRPGVKHVFHLYMVRVSDRDGLLAHLNRQGIEAKVHYPVPVHLQPAAKSLGYRPGDFPQAEADSRSIITLPAHQHLSDDDVAYTIAQVRAFYARPT